MPERKRSKKPAAETLRQARITTRTADDMLGLLKGRAFEIVGRGPHRSPDGSYFAEVIAQEEELEKLPEGDWEVVIREPTEVKARAKELSRSNRYAKRGAVPRGLGVKKK